MIMTSFKKGPYYEKQALEYLLKQRYVLLETNYRSPWGEIDLIVKDVRSTPHTLVFVEVKFRESLRFGAPLEAVSSGKQRKILRSANAYLNRTPYQGPCRFDVIGILGDQIEHLENAFESLL